MIYKELFAVYLPIIAIATFAVFNVVNVSAMTSQEAISESSEYLSLDGNEGRSQGSKNELPNVDSMESDEYIGNYGFAKNGGLKIYGNETKKNCKEKLVNALSATPDGLIPSSLEIELGDFDTPGKASKSGVKLDCDVPESRFLRIFWHELGHFYHLNGGFEGFERYFGGDEGDGAGLYNQNGQPNYITNYAATNLEEDIAESFAEYLLDKERFQNKANTSPALEAKYEIIEAYFISVDYK
jgi:hypothetical protein